jgi:hypothetical protein
MHSASERAAVSALRNDVKRMEAASGAKKDFETEHSGVFAAPGSPLAHFLTAESGFNIRKDEEKWPTSVSLGSTLRR